MRTPSQLTEAFRSKGLKITPQRQLIFRLLHGNDTHPTAEAVYAAAVAEMPAISLRTVYQTLNDLAGMGELQVLDLGTGSARFDPNVDEHHHVVCDHCGQVRDVYLDGAVPRPGPESLAGFAITSVEVTFRGHCTGCTTSHSQGDHTHG